MKFIVYLIVPDAAYLCNLFPSLYPLAYATLIILAAYIGIRLDVFVGTIRLVLLLPVSTAAPRWQTI